METFPYLQTSPLLCPLAKLDHVSAWASPRRTPSPDVNPRGVVDAVYCGSLKLARTLQYDQSLSYLLCRVDRREVLLHVPCTLEPLPEVVPRTLGDVGGRRGRDSRRGSCETHAHGGERGQGTGYTNLPGKRTPAQKTIRHSWLQTRQAKGGWSVAFPLRFCSKTEYFGSRGTTALTLPTP